MFWIVMMATFIGISLIVIGFMLGIYSKAVFKNTMDNWIEAEMSALHKNINNALLEADEQCKQMVQQARLEIYTMQEHSHNVRTEQPLN